MRNHLCAKSLLAICLLVAPGQTVCLHAQSPGASPAGPVTGRPIAVQPVPVTRPLASVLAARKPTVTVTVPASGTWVDTGLVVTPADHLEFSAAGSVTLADGRRSSPAGVPKGWKDLLRGYLVDGANSGALVGRVGDAAAAIPFSVGAALSQNMAVAGELFLAVNVAPSTPGTGNFQATLRLTAAAVSAETVAAFDFSRWLTPSLLAELPRRVSDEQQNPGDVVNFAVVGTQAEVVSAFAAAQWVAVDQTTNGAVVHALIATLSKRAYLEMPMSTLYLFGRPQDLSYARADPLVVAMVRHHLRLWDTHRTVAGRPLWVGSATHDNGLERDQRDNGLTHHIDPNIDVERDFVQQSFAAAGRLEGAAYVTPSNSVRSGQTATGGSFQTDGRLLVMILR